MNHNASPLFMSGGDEWETVAPGVQRGILGYDGALMMVAVRFENGAVGAPHHHAHRQVTYIAEGSFEVTIDGQTRTLAAGGSFFVPPNAVHGVIALSAGVLVDVFTPAREDFLA
jgi:quercetin dioxygenase-like cupin family protein